MEQLAVVIQQYLFTTLIQIWCGSSTTSSTILSQYLPIESKGHVDVKYSRLPQNVRQVEDQDLNEDYLQRTEYTNLGELYNRMLEGTKVWVNWKDLNSLQQYNPWNKGTKGDYEYIWPNTPVSKEEDLVVPKVLHFIWTGGPLPDKYKENINRFVEHNQDYQVRQMKNTHMIKILM